MKPLTNRAQQAALKILGLSIMLMLEAQSPSPPQGQVAFMRLKHGIHGKFVQLREFGESDL